MSIKKGDIVIILLLTAAFAGWMGYRYLSEAAEGSDVVIKLENNIVQRIPLSSISEPKELHVDLSNGKYIDVIIESDGVYVKEATCPDEVCKKTGKINRQGQSIVCLPNRVIIHFEGQVESDIDGVTY